MCIRDSGTEDYKNRSAYYRMNYPIDYKTDSLYITKFEKDAKNSMIYNFIGAFPISIAASPVSYDNSDTLKCTVSFSFMRYLRRRSGTALDKKGFIYQYLTGEKSWTYVPPRSFSWIGGSSFQDELDQIWDNIWDGDNNTEEDKSGDEDSSQQGQTIITLPTTAIPGDRDYQPCELFPLA